MLRSCGKYSCPQLTVGLFSAVNVQRLGVPGSRGEFAWGKKKNFDTFESLYLYLVPSSSRHLYFGIQCQRHRARSECSVSSVGAAAGRAGRGAASAGLRRRGRGRQRRCCTVAAALAEPGSALLQFCRFSTYAQVSPLDCIRACSTRVVAQLLPGRVCLLLGSRVRRQ